MKHIDRSKQDWLCLIQEGAGATDNPWAGGECVCHTGTIAYKKWLQNVQLPTDGCICENIRRIWKKWDKLQDTVTISKKLNYPWVFPGTAMAWLE